MTPHGQTGGSIRHIEPEHPERRSSSREEIPGELITEEHEACRPDQHVCRICAPVERAGAPPKLKSNQDDRERRELAQFHADVERQDVAHQAVS